jgi:hypothetical protein
MSLHATAAQARRFSFGRLLGYFREIQERRQRRYAQTRAQWIEEVRHAPTVQELMDGSQR